MLQTDLEYKKGILFIRLSGILDKESSIKLRKEIIPIILNNGFKYVVINLNKLNLIDKYGIDIINEINYVVSKFNGKTTLIDNKRMKNLLNNIIYKAKDERIALGVFGL